jgi:PAS domain S-box-containing protein
MEKPGDPVGTVLVSGGKGIVSKLAKHGIRARQGTVRHRTTPAPVGAVSRRFHLIVCKNLAEVARRLDDSTDAIVLAEQTLVRSKARRLFLRALARQPSWSDVPVIVLPKTNAPRKLDWLNQSSFPKTARKARSVGEASSREPGKETCSPALQILADANVTILPASSRIAGLITALRTAARTRRHQRAVGHLLEQREAALASISDAFSVLDRNWRYTYVNDRVLELTGKRKEQLIGHVIWEVFPQAVGTEFYHRCHRAMETQEPDRFEVFYRPWGRWVDTRIYPSSEGLSIYRADLSELMEQQKRLRENEQRLYVAEERIRLALEAADVGTFDYYPAVGVIRWSDRCNQLFGLPAGTKPDYATYLDAIHPDDRRIIHEALREVLSPGSSGQYEIQYRAIGVNDSKERWLEEKGRAILDDAGRPARFVGTILEITQRKQAEDALKKAKQDAENANRAKDQFLAMLSHELRTPLTPVLMTIASLQRRLDIPDHARRDLDVLRRNVELEALLIDDLLDLTRIAHGKLELRNDAIDVHAALTYALGVSASDLNEKQINVQQDFAATEHHCWADAARLQQVFWNIIKNAVKFTPARGQLRISTRNDPAHNIVIDFTDTGIGINPELQPRIFDAFEQGGKGVTNHYGGLGLGLAISKRVIDLHGGKISVHSEGPGTGATFTIKLKAMETSLLEGPAYPIDHDVADNSGADILLVEDHEDTARALQRMLENAGFRVSYASTLASARDLAAKRSFQLVISDLGLPDGSGLDLMDELRSSGAVRGIALSGFGSDGDVAAAKAAGFAEHFTKPVDWERLRHIIHRLLNGRS